MNTDTPRKRVLGWCCVALLIYLLIAAVSIISGGFSGLSSDTAHSIFEFAGHPLVGLAVGILATVLIQSSTTVTAIAVTAVGSGVLPLTGAIPIILGANVGTTVTSTVVALTFMRKRDEFERALAASSIHDFYNWLALAVFFPIEILWHPLRRSSQELADIMYGAQWLPNPDRFDFISSASRPVVSAVREITSGFSDIASSLVMIAVGAVLIFLVVNFLGKLLKLLLVGKAREVLTTAVGKNSAVAVASGMGVTALTQSSTITTSVLVPFVGAGALSPKEMYPVTVGANLGTTFTAILAAFAVSGADAKIGLVAAFVHLLYNLFAILVVYVNPILRPLPLSLAETFARVAAERKWVIALYVTKAFIVLPALIVVLFGVL